MIRQCAECGQVWLAGDPGAGRLPQTCPNDCNATVLEVYQTTNRKEPSMELLGVDADVQTIADVLNDLDISCTALRAVREFLTNEDQWPDDGKHFRDAVYAQGLLLSGMIRHIEQLVNAGHQFEFARRRQESPAA